MGEADRKEAIALEHVLRRVFTNHHLVPKMHAILATSTSDEQRYVNAKRIAADLALVHPEHAAPLYAKTQPIIEALSTNTTNAQKTHRMTHCSITYQSKKLEQTPST